MTPPVDCHDEIGSDLHVVGGSSIVKIHANGSSHSHTQAATAANGQSSQNGQNGQTETTIVAEAVSDISGANNTIKMEGEGEERKKASIVVDVIIEAIFIVGKYRVSHVVVDWVLLT